MMTWWICMVWGIIGGAAFTIALHVAQAIDRERAKRKAERELLVRLPCDASPRDRVRNPGSKTAN